MLLEVVVVSVGDMGLEWEAKINSGRMEYG